MEQVLSQETIENQYPNAVEPGAIHHMCWPVAIEIRIHRLYTFLSNKWIWGSRAVMREVEILLNLYVS